VVEASDAIATLTIEGSDEAGQAAGREPARNCNWTETMKTERDPSPAEEGSPSENKRSLKERAVHQLREFSAMFLYLWALFALLVMNQSAVLRHAHDAQAHGFAIINALILAKVLLIGEDLRIGNRFRDKPLLYSIFYRCFVFTILIMAFHVVERLIGGLFSGRTIAQSFPDVGHGSLKGIFSVAATAFVALIPFFAFREISRVIGSKELWSLLLTRGNRVYTLQSRPQQ